ncbi:Flagellar biosynthesis protein FlhB [Liberibacter crescens BT-1]|uniref:Flagellar biosynthesis protein FlhB n=1 Tax=Liberibacter crescens (strain BT-1) TaxID=1215343 RepID=L0ERQ3_LIBCB|nr:flagellar type III secretion system protein FlhB [Liberibacter crescens]AGA64174.1 Flagellar biosynthesis protein FlhB [Liberibacter crescens BT-1]AMC12437.1 flagellar biosynthesis protein FlhB [Liberibacter crescens]
MSEDNNKDNKTEAPSTTKVQDAIDKGNVPISRELALFTSVLGFLIYLSFFIPSSIINLAVDLRSFFEKSEQWELNNNADVLAILMKLTLNSSKLVIPCFLLLMIFNISAYLIQKCPSVNFDKLKPSLNKLSIYKGWKRIYSINNLIDFTKIFLKIIVISIFITLSLKDNFSQIPGFMSSDPFWILKEVYIIIQEILIVILLFMACLTALDLYWTYYNWYSQLKMSKEEIKEETKLHQGNPLVKSRQRSIAFNRAKNRMIKAVSSATLVITNPTHYSLALRYKREENDAPVMLAKGKNLIALKIREVAEQNNIPIFEDPILARSLFKQVPINKAIPPVFYKAVAQLIHKIYSKKLN